MGTASRPIAPCRLPQHQLKNRLMDLASRIHGKSTVELTVIRPLGKPLHRCVQKAHVLIFPEQIMRRALYVNEHLLWHRDKVTQEIQNV